MRRARPLAECEGLIRKSFGAFSARSYAEAAAAKLEDVMSEREKLDALVVVHNFHLYMYILYTYTCICIHISLSLYLSIYRSIYMSIYIYMCIFKYIHIDMAEHI